jgi:hypothetical protein
MKLALALALAALALGCGRAHLEPAHGSSYRAQFALQGDKPPGAKATAAAVGLDAQEASIISAAYRKGLAPKDAQQGEEEPILVVAPQQQGGVRAMLPLPSVPRE